MSFLQKNNKLVAYAIILLGLFVLVLVAKPQLDALQENIDTKETLIIDISDKRTLAEHLNSIEEKLEAQGLATQNYTQEVTQEQVVEYLYETIWDISNEAGIASIKSLSFTQPKKNDLGFMQMDVTMSVKVGNTTKLKTILKSLTSDTQKYKFYIESLQFPYGSKGVFTVNIPLKLFYK